MLKERVRDEVVAGIFYPSNKLELKEQLANLIPGTLEKKYVLGIISPHAGYIYSGACAGKVFGLINIPDTVLVIGVAHGSGLFDFGIEDATYWRTPIGDVKVNESLSENILKNGQDIFCLSEGLNSNEHSIEVQLPFLKYLNPQVQIVPILVATHDTDKIEQAGRLIADCLKGKGNSVLIVASTDFSHYISARKAESLDSLAIEEIKALNPQRLMEVVEGNRISMCGVGPTSLMMATAKNLGATRSELVNYTNSGEVSGDFDQVVAYASFYTI